VALVQPAISPPDSGGLPARIDIADIGLSAAVESLVRTEEGTLATPQNWNDAGWYAEGVAPGEPGPAVIVGHRDSAADGAAVFYRLGELTPGADVTITERDGSTTHFIVQSLQQVAKADFPTDEVYGPSAHRLLRLITCTGDFDFDAGSYLDNLVVTARAV
jgi:sortase (surface protein transpeptidase)